MCDPVVAVFFIANVIPHWGQVGSHWFYVTNVESNIFCDFFPPNVESHWGLGPQCDITLLLFASSDMLASNNNTCAASCAPNL